MWKRFSSPELAHDFIEHVNLQLGSSYISMKPLESVARVNPRTPWTFGATCGCTVATCRRYRWKTKIVGCIFGTRDTGPCNHYVVHRRHSRPGDQNFRCCWKQIQRIGKSTWAATSIGPSRLPSIQTTYRHGLGPASPFEVILFLKQGLLIINRSVRIQINVHSQPNVKVSIGNGILVWRL